MSNQQSMENELQLFPWLYPTLRRSQNSISKLPFDSLPDINITKQQLREREKQREGDRDRDLEQELTHMTE